MKLKMRTRDDWIVVLDDGSEYNVVPREVDPMGKYDIAEIRAYADSHPGDVEAVEPSGPSMQDLYDSCLSSRRMAYATEADPLFFGSERGENTREEWLAKIAEIKARYPKPEVT